MFFLYLYQFIWWFDPGQSYVVDIMVDYNGLSNDQVFKLIFPVVSYFLPFAALIVGFVYFRLGFRAALPLLVICNCLSSLLVLLARKDLIGMIYASEIVDAVGFCFLFVLPCEAFSRSVSQHHFLSGKINSISLGSTVSSALLGLLIARYASKVAALWVSFSVSCTLFPLMALDFFKGSLLTETAKKDFARSCRTSLHPSTRAGTADGSQEESEDLLNETETERDVLLRPAPPSASLSIQSIKAIVPLLVKDRLLVAWCLFYICMRAIHTSVITDWQSLLESIDETETNYNPVISSAGYLSAALASYWGGKLHDTFGWFGPNIVAFLSLVAGFILTLPLLTRHSYWFSGTFVVLYHALSEAILALSLGHVAALLATHLKVDPPRLNHSRPSVIESSRPSHDERSYYLLSNKFYIPCLCVNFFSASLIQLVTQLIFGGYGLGLGISAKFECYAVLIFLIASGFFWRVYMYRIQH